MHRKRFRLPDFAFSTDLEAIRLRFCRALCDFKSRDFTAIWSRIAMAIARFGHLSRKVSFWRFYVCLARLFLQNSGPFCHPQPPSLLFLLLEPGSERKVLTKETWFPLLREWKSWKLQWEQFLPLNQGLLSKNFHSRPGCRRKILSSEPEKLLVPVLKGTNYTKI